METQGNTMWEYDWYTGIQYKGMTGACIPSTNSGNKYIQCLDIYLGYILLAGSVIKS